MGLLIDCLLIFYIFFLQKSKGLHLEAGTTEQLLGDLKGVSCVKHAPSCFEGMAISMVLSNVSGFGYILSTGREGMMTPIYQQDNFIK